MNQIEQEQLAQRVKREAKRKASVKLGQTNGRLCVHVNDREPVDASRSSFTLYGANEWVGHALNRGVRSVLPAESKPAPERDEYLSPKETSVSVSRLTPEMAARLESSRIRPVVSEDG